MFWYQTLFIAHYSRTSSSGDSGGVVTLTLIKSVKIVQMWSFQQIQRYYTLQLCVVLKSQCILDPNIYLTQLLNL